MTYHSIEKLRKEEHDKNLRRVLHASSETVQCHIKKMCNFSKKKMKFLHSGKIVEGCIIKPNPEKGRAIETPCLQYESEF